MKALTLGLVLYRLTVETGMPHLEENLRYATVDETRCLTRAELATIFPVLKHPALQDCALHLQSEDDASIAYGLSCTGAHGTTGSARWEISAHQLRGVLNVRLGGKNMTFYQRITAIETGDSCDTATRAASSGPAYSP
jgi:hypothetical protein